MASSNSPVELSKLSVSIDGDVWEVVQGDDRTVLVQGKENHSEIAFLFIGGERAQVYYFTIKVHNGTIVVKIILKGKQVSADIYHGLGQSPALKDATYTRYIRDESKFEFKQTQNETKEHPCQILFEEKLEDAKMKQHSILIQRESLPSGETFKSYLKTKEGRVVNVKVEEPVPFTV